MRSQFYASATAKQTPAHLLYQHWMDTLEPFLGPYRTYSKVRSSMLYGYENHYGIGWWDEDIAGQPIVGFGPAWAGNSVNPFLAINADGEFQIRHMFGYKQRSILARMSFLNWSHRWGQYHWFYSPDGIAGGYHNGELIDYRNQRFYVPEFLTGGGTRSWLTELPWWRLEPEPADADGWKIVFSRHAKTTGGYPSRTFQVTQVDVDKHETLRKKRYARIEKEHLIATGVLDDKGRPTADIQADENAKRQTAAQILSEHFQVSTPTVTKPLKRHEEEGLWLPNGCL